MPVALLILWVLATAAGAGTNRVTEQAIHQAVESFVCDQLEEKTQAQERFEVHVRWQGDILLEAQGVAQLEVRPVSPRPLRGPTVVQVEIRVNGRAERVLNLTVDTRFYREVLVAARSIRRGETVAAEMVQRQERDITAQKNGWFTEVAELEGMRARRPVGFDDILTRDHVESLPVVWRGAAVALVVETGNLRISAQGIALQDGGPGARIRARNTDSGKVVWGEVVDDHTLRIAR